MLKIKIISAVFLLLLSTGGVDANMYYEAPSAPKFAISNGALNVNGTKFNQPWKINPFLTALGGKYVTKNLFHKVYTFDAIGVHVYEYQKKEEANEIQLSFTRQKMNFAPKNNFSGSFKIEKMTITRKTTIEKIQKSLPTYNFTKSHSGNSYRGEYKGVYIYLNYSTDAQIDFISFGMSGRT
jgi:hypothetical protein